MRSSARRAVSPVTGALVVSCYPKTGCRRSLTITLMSARGAGGSSPTVRRFRGTGRAAIKLRTCRRPRCSMSSIAPSGCGARDAPSGLRAALGIVGESAFGPGLQAAVVALTARNRISRRDMSELLRELFAVRISVGAIDRICQRTSGLLAGPHERLCSQVLGSGAVNVDETGWLLAGENRTMWTAATAQAAVFRIVEDRHRDRLVELLGADFQGIVTSDRWWAYDLLDVEQRQACWSHLQRDFRFHSEGLAAQQQFGEAGLALTHRLFETWHAFAEHQDRARLVAEMTPIQSELRKLLEHAGNSSKRHRLFRRFANNLLKLWPALWAFITIPGVSPTNNAAERALRGPVIHRKLSHANQSDDGERFTERSLSASITCRLQHRSLLAYLRDLLTAHQTGGALPAHL